MHTDSAVASVEALYLPAAQSMPAGLVTLAFLPASQDACTWHAAAELLLV